MSEAPQDKEPVVDLPLGSREALENALGDRTRPTEEDAARIAALEGLDLRQAVYRASDALAVFDDVLLQLHDESFCLEDALVAMDASALTTDHGWSEVLNVLAGLPEDGDELRAVGLVKYRRYLRNRLEALESRQAALIAPAPALAQPGSAESGDEQSSDEEIALDLELLADDDEPDVASRGAGEPTVMHRPADDGGDERREARPGTDSESADAAAGAHDAGAAEMPQRLLRLHRGKPVALAVAGREEVELWLGRSRFRLLLGGGPRLVAEYGECGRLRNGRSLVGRSPDCEIVIDARHDTVSRVHLEVEVEHGQLVAVTDLSSGGTYVRPEMVPRRTNAA